MNCQNCGKPLVQGAHFCTHCGMKAVQPQPTTVPRPISQPAPPQAISQPASQQANPQPTPQTCQYQQIYGTAAQPTTPAVSQSALEENPVRAMILAAAFAAAIFISTFFVLGWDSTSSGYLEVLYTGLLACGVYLVMKPGILPRVIAALIAILAPWLYGNALAIFFVSRTRMTLNLFAIFEPGHISYFTNNLYYSVGIIAIAFGLSFLIKRIKKHPAAIAGLCIGGSSLLLVIILSIPSIVSSGIQIALMRMVADIPTALTLGLGTAVVYMLCTMKSYDLETKTGHKIWFGLCLTFTTISFLVTSLGGVMGTMYFTYSGFILVLLTIIAIVGYVQLFMSKRLGYLLILIAAGTMFFGSVSLNFSQFAYALFTGSGPALLYLANIASSLSVIVNPTITGIVVLFIWKKIPSQKPYLKPQVPSLFKAFSIAGTAIGAILFLVGSAEFFNPYAIRSMGTLPSVSFVCGVFFGAATLVVGIYAILACFRKGSKAPKGLLIVNLVSTILAVLFLIVIIAT